MKKLLYVFLLSPLMSYSQTPSDYLIFEIATLKVAPANVAQVENALGDHDKKYHASGPSGVRVYSVESGSHSGEYKWIMGPSPWSALDSRPDDELHNMDYDSKVGRYLMPETNTEYIQLDTKLSRFPADFNVNKLFVRYIDIARGKMDQAKEILEKVRKVYAEKIPGETYGVYWNEIPSTSSGRDLVIVSFFEKYAWMSTDDGFDAKYNEMYGKGSADEMWNQWRAITLGQESEIWSFREDLSGLPALVKAADRQ